MKCKELIEKLTSIMDDCGDVEVRVYAPNELFDVKKVTEGGDDHSYRCVFIGVDKF